MRKVLALAAAGALAAGLAITALAASGGAATEIDTAHTHALLAQKSTTLSMARMHLHHVLNCLVGPKGAGFDAAVGVPCKGQGNGAIPDSAHDKAAQGKLQTALAQVRVGLKAPALAATQQEASKVAATLQGAAMR